MGKVILKHWLQVHSWWFLRFEFHLDNWGRGTPQKSNIDTKNCHFLKGVTFSKPSFWVSMLVFGGVNLLDFYTFFRSDGLFYPLQLKTNVMGVRSSKLVKIFFTFQFYTSEARDPSDSEMVEVFFLGIPPKKPTSI